MEVKVTMCSRRGHRSLTNDREPATERKPPTRAEVVIGTGGSSFADIVRQLEETAGETIISRVAKNNNGDVVVRVAGGKESATALAQALQRTHQNAQVRTRGRRVLLHVNNLLDGCTKEQLAGSMREALGTTTADFHVLEVRPAFGGTARGAVLVAEEEATAHMQRPIRVGPVSVTFRKAPDRCRQCGSLRHKKCNKPLGSRRCFRCQKEGHLIKECPQARQPSQ